MLNREQVGVTVEYYGDPVLPCILCLFESIDFFRKYLQFNILFFNFLTIEFFFLYDPTY